MDNIKTVDDGNYLLDNLYSSQKEGVSKMRASLLASSADNPTSMVHAIRSITVMRIYHQLTRIIKYTELMDKIEAKLYQSVDAQLDDMDNNLATVAVLVKLQSDLQKSMIESHKLLEQYMNKDIFNTVDLVPEPEVESNVISLNSEKRDSIRTKAQLLLEELNAG